MAFIYLPRAVSSTYTRGRRREEGFHADNQNTHTQTHKMQPPKKKYQTQKQHTDSLQKALVIVKRLRSQSAETGKWV